MDAITSNESSLIHDADNEGPPPRDAATAECGVPHPSFVFATSSRGTRGMPQPAAPFPAPHFETRRDPPRAPSP